jgi:hypothetical protein
LSITGVDMDDFMGEYQSDYATPASVAALVGAYALRSGDIFNVGAGGAVSLSEASTGCTYAGSVSVIDQNYSVYRLQVTASSCTSLPWNGAVQTGIVSFLGYAPIDGSDVVFGGTHFTDTTGAAQLKLFQ